MSRRAALFDLDGTLTDSIGDLCTALNETRSCYGAEPLAKAQVRGYIGDGVKLLVERGLAGIPHDPEEAVKLQLENYRKHWLDTTCLYPGVEEGLRKLHDAGWVLGVVTNKPEPAARRVLEHLKVRDLMDGLAGGEAGLPLKPDPAGCLDILEKTGVKPGNSAMIGDHYADLEAGRRAGMLRVLVTWGYGDPREEKWDYAAPDFPALVNWLLNSKEIENG